MPKVLHVLSQRPSLTGSGVTLVELARHAEAAGWEQMAVIGVPAEAPRPKVGVLGADRVRPLAFGHGDLDFPIPGMSDVMPYPSSRFSELSKPELTAYREAWLRHLESVLTECRPDLIHSHHVWLVSSWLKDVAPDIRVVTHSHGTGLRQLELCPHLAEEVRQGNSRNDRFLALHQDNQVAIVDALGLDGGATTSTPPAEERVQVVGAGFAEQIFRLDRDVEGRAGRLLYVGKYSASKGLPSLLEAVEGLLSKHSGLELHVAGSGAGNEAEALQERMVEMAPAVVLHGQLSQPELAALMNTCAVCILPSFYEGLPLVLAEAYACGCQLVATALPGVEKHLAPSLGEDLELVRLPRMTGVDTPFDEDMPAFVEALGEAIDVALRKSVKPVPKEVRSEALGPFTWRAVFSRVERVWVDLL
ncbi:MAG: glycosyltransferase family 4 protein [Thermoanaerobaculia bacterium]